MQKETTRTPHATSHTALSKCFDFRSGHTRSAYGAGTFYGVVTHTTKRKKSKKNK